MTDQPATPELSVIAITPDTYATVRPLLRCLSRQTASDRIEVVLCGPSRAALDFDPQEMEAFASHQVVEIGELRSTSVARAAGIRAAQAPVVALSEDHCFPRRDWAEAILARHREPWSGVGVSLVNGNPQSAVSWANFIIEYGDWADPVTGGESSHIPGHNSTYKRAALLEYGDDLGDVLEAESPMQWEMGTRGHRFFVEPRARVHHLNFSLLQASIQLRFWGGRLFAANRARGWGLGRRAVYFAASPLIPVVRLRRAIKTLWRLRKAKGQKSRWPVLVPTIAMLLILDGLGETAGYAFGRGSSMDQISGWGEFHRGRFVRSNEWREALTMLTMSTHLDMTSAGDSRDRSLGSR